MLVVRNSPPCWIWWHWHRRLYTYHVRHNGVRY